jgi:GNAT superfamily N-acetyltransferase
MVHIKRLPNSDIARIADIDRTEHVTTGYTVRDGELHAEAVDWHVPRWYTSGRGSHRLATLVEDCAEILTSHNGVLFGALEGEQLVGVAILRPRLEGDMAELSFLHVSHGYRRQGIGTRLVHRVCTLARQLGARRMYVSATPSESAVGFYCHHGFRLAAKPHPELFAREPEDIHMIKQL